MNPFDSGKLKSYEYNQNVDDGGTTISTNINDYSSGGMGTVSGIGTSTVIGGGIGVAMGGVRPRVDVDATGEVDPTLYPEPKEAKQKIRSHADVIQMLFGSDEHELIAVKSFYFFFYAAFGSLFPLMGVYFKQMGMNPGQCGILIGMRPFVEFLSAPFWGSYADRCRQGKKLLLASLTCWILFTIPLSFIKPEAIKCIERNHSDYVLTYTRIKRHTPINLPFTSQNDNIDSTVTDTNIAEDYSDEFHNTK